MQRHLCRFTLSPAFLREITKNSSKPDASKKVLAKLVIYIRFKNYTFIRVSKFDAVFDRSGCCSPGDFKIQFHIKEGLFGFPIK